MGSRAPLDRLLDRCEWVGDCLIWQGATVRGRSGTFRATSRAKDPKVYVHRYVYEMTVGPIPDGHEIDHVRAKGCTSPLCCNPDHLEPVLPIENMRRARIDLCRSGRHDLTDPANCHWDAAGRRRGCIICHRESARASSARRYEARKAVA